jgi:hypothetical protein
MTISGISAWRLLHAKPRSNDAGFTDWRRISRENEFQRSANMPATTQWENRTSRRQEFKVEKSGPSLREIRCTTAAVRENWTRSERQFRAQMAQLLQQQLLDRIAAVPFGACEKAAIREASLA